MTIEKSAQYQADLKIKRTFAEITESIQSAEKQIVSLLELAASMRRTVGTALLNLSHVEALFVDNCHNRRNAEAQLDEVKQRLDDLTGRVNAKVGGGVEHVKKAANGLSAVHATTERVVVDRYVKDDEKGAPLPGLSYVDISYFMEQSRKSRKVVDGWRVRGLIPEHDAVDYESGGQPKLLWLKHKANAALVSVNKHLAA